MTHDRAAGLAALPLPAGLHLAPGADRSAPLARAAPPEVDLSSDSADGLLSLLAYAGVRYRDPGCPAAGYGLQVFAAGRDLALRGPHAAISFDWDHTLSNFQIVEDLPRLLRVRMRATPPTPRQHAAPMIAIETARPFMIELVFGTLAGFALRQGLRRLGQWAHYVPQVLVASHTWPDRLGVMGSHFMPILPLLEGLLPGEPTTYARLSSPAVRSILNLHHFLAYAESLLQRYESGGAGALSPAELDELLTLFEDGKAHHRKPLGAWAMRGWPVERLLHIDDSSRVVADVARQGRLGGHPHVRALHVRQPHSRLFTDIQEWHKISLPAFWRGGEGARLRAAHRLAHMEWAGSPFPGLLHALSPGASPAEAAPPAGRPGPDWPGAGLPEGVLITVHETPTTLGEFWTYYVEPTRRIRQRVGALRPRRGGLRALRQAVRTPG